MQEWRAKQSQDGFPDSAHLDHNFRARVRGLRDRESFEEIVESEAVSDHRTQVAAAKQLKHIFVPFGVLHGALDQDLLHEHKHEGDRDGFSV